MKKTLLALALSMALIGCATAPDKIAASYVSPLQYSNYDCDQISAELARVGSKANELNGALAKKASGDTAKTTIGMILFFPALFFLDGDSPQATEFARLKGEYEALQKVAIEKKCSVNTAPIQPLKTKAEDIKPTQTGVVGGN